ncbi:MAG: glycosyltransferase [Caulobacter sp.]
MRGELGDTYDGTPFVQVNHTLSGPIVPARLRDDRRFAYCGINWERLSKAKGRFDALLTRLDEHGVLDIFGPEQVRGVRVWEGFKGYKYAVPFDGRTLIEELGRSGAVLAFSSQAHIRSGIMSNRLFEGAAAGALVFADQNPFVSRYFKDEVVEVPLGPDGQLDAGFLLSALAHFNANPEAAFAKASALQNKFTEFYALHRQLLGAFTAYAAARDARAAKIAALTPETTPTLDAVVLALDENAPLPQDLLTDLCAMPGVRTKVTLVMRGPPAAPRAFDFLPEGAIEVVSTTMSIGDSPNSIGFVLAEVLGGLQGDYVSVFLGHERVFTDYGARLTEALAQSGGPAVRTGVVIRHYDPAQRLFDGAEYADYARPVGKRPTPMLTLANFMFRRDALVRASGAFQFMAWSGMLTYLHETFAKPPVVDAPLCSADLKLYERLRAIGQQPYEAGKAVAVLARYTTPTVKALTEAAPAGMPITAAAIAALPEQERRDIIVSLLKTLPLPPWIIRGGGKALRLVMGIRRPKR